MFFLSLFHCVDHTPHPLGQVAFAEAVAKGLDAGLHRQVSESSALTFRTLSSYNCNDQVENEIRVVGQFRIPSLPVAHSLGLLLP